MIDAPAPVLARVEGAIGHLTLDRPQALNALDLGMVRALRAALDAWERDPAVAAVLLDGAGERGFCAGGDVRALHAGLAAGDVSGARAFFREEYALNARLAEYPKPIVAIADGVTMGGGVGLAGHVSLRIVTERSRVAMPETRIGFTPDVGGSLLLARAPGRLGEYLALTGTAMDAADAIAAGLADVMVPTASLSAFRAALTSLPSSASHFRSLSASHTDRKWDMLGGFAADARADAGESRLMAAREWIDPAFAADSVPEIVARLEASDVAEAREAAALLAELSPTSLVVALEAVRRARALDLRGALAQEYGLVDWFATTQPDLVEGIRAQLVDKDRTPRWSPATLDALDPGLVAAAFAHAPEPPLWTAS